MGNGHFAERREASAPTLAPVPADRIKPAIRWFRGLSEIVDGYSGALVLASGDDDGLRDAIVGCALYSRAPHRVRIVDPAVARTEAPTCFFNPFGSGSPETVRAMLEALIGNSQISADEAVLRERALVLVRSLVPILVGLRDRDICYLNLRTVCDSLGYDWICRLLDDGKILSRGDGSSYELDVRGRVSEAVTAPLRQYRNELPGYDPTRPWQDQIGREAERQLDYVHFCTKTLLRNLDILTSFRRHSLQRIVDTTEVVRRSLLLVVRLSSAEFSPAAIASMATFLTRCFEAVAEAAQIGPFPVLIDAKLSDMVGTLRAGAPINPTIV